MGIVPVIESAGGDLYFVVVDGKTVGEVDFLVVTGRRLVTLRKDGKTSIGAVDASDLRCDEDLANDSFFTGKVGGTPVFRRR